MAPHSKIALDDLNEATFKPLKLSDRSSYWNVAVIAAVGSEEPDVQRAHSITASAVASSVAGI